jgi:predicted RNA-binding protein associated with RNAse of E/G family
MPAPVSWITVVKLDYTGAEKWRYQGKLVQRETHRIVLEALFDREIYPVHELVLRRGDRFVETYFDNRWYNIYEIFDRGGGGRKAWYCNIGRPATIQDNLVSYQDLALDLLVYPNGRQIVLDEDEFDRLNLAEDTRAQARHALAELQSRFMDVARKWDGGPGSFRLS